MSFAVIYKFHLRPGLEREYRKLWRQVATYFTEERGALGSCLHKTAEGEWMAYSRWPNKATRDASWPQEGEKPSETLDPHMKSVILAIKDCIDNTKPFQEICMDVVDDLLLKARTSDDSQPASINCED